MSHEVTFICCSHDSLQNLTLFHHHPMYPASSTSNHLLSGGAGGETHSTEVAGGLHGEGRRTLRFPSAVIRSRLQVPQKCSDMDVMKLTWPWKPGILKACRGAGEGVRAGALG